MHLVFEARHRGGRLGEGLLANPALLDRIAAEIGTPVYVYDAAAIRARYEELASALAERFPYRVHYSVKANSNLAVLRLLRSLGAGADIVSGGELARSLAAGFAPEDIVFAGVGKTPAELEAAVRAGPVQINLESAGELDALTCVAERLRARVRVGIRVNPDVAADTHPYTRTGERSVKFGVPIDEVLSMARHVCTRPELELRALGMHLGSQIADPAPYAAGAAKLAALITELQRDGVTSLTSADVGGGLAIAYGPTGRCLDPGAFADAIAGLARETGLRIVVEPGRFLVGNAGCLLTRVLYRKRAGGHEFAIVDGGMSDLLRPSLYAAEHEIVVVEVAVSQPDQLTVDIVGPICETGDFLGFRRSLPGAVPGALLAVLGTGAYGFAMASNYNSRTRPAEVLVDGERWAVVRARETATDLTRGESPDPQWR